jgi:hypothetical protein
MFIYVLALVFIHLFLWKSTPKIIATKATQVHLLDQNKYLQNIKIYTFY